MQTLKEHKCQPRILYPAKLSITIDGENKIFHDKTKFKQYLSTNPALQKILEGKLQPKEENYNHKNIGNKQSKQPKSKEAKHKHEGTHAHMNEHVCTHIEVRKWVSGVPLNHSFPDPLRQALLLELSVLVRLADQ